MKLHLLLPPIAALIAGCVWLGYLASSRSFLASTNTALRERVADAKPIGGEVHPIAEAEQRARGGPKLAHGKQVSADLGEWLRLAEEAIMVAMADTANIDSTPSWRLAREQKGRLEKMSAAEMLAFVDQLAGPDVSGKAKDELLSMFADAAAQKDPQLTLRHFESLLAEDDHPISAYVAKSFAWWLTKDAAGAIAWLDEATAAGKFATKHLDGKNPMFLNSAGQVIGLLFTSDPAASMARLKALPEDHRWEIVQRNFRVLAPGTELAYAELVRKGLPEAQRDSGFCNVTRAMIEKQDFAGVSSLLDTVGATAAERLAVASSVTAEDFTAMPYRYGTQVTKLHEWLKQQAPQAADRLAGTALASNVSRTGLEMTMALVTDLQANTGRDEIMEAFFASPAVSSQADKAKTMAAKIKDVALRKKIQGLISQGSQPVPATNHP